MWRGIKVSVAFPAFNEEPNVGRAVEAFRAAGIVDEIVVADNGSTDRTREIAEKAGARVVCEYRRGMGAAVRCALAECRGDVVILCEPDGTFAAEDMEKLLIYSAGFDLVLGTRTNQALIWRGANMGLFLKWGNWVVAKLLELLFNGPALTDMGCSYRLFKADALKTLLPRLSVNGSHCLPEQVVEALASGLRLVEIPVNYRPRIGVSKITGSRWRAAKVGLRMIALVVGRRLFHTP